MFRRLRKIFEPDDEQRAAEFWRWFAANEHVYRGLQTQDAAEQAHSLDIFGKHLGRYDDALYYLFGPTPEAPEGRQSLIITASGEAAHFAAADYLVAQAPALPGWEPTALKPPTPELTEVALGGHTYALADLHFAQVRVPDEPAALMLHVFFPAFDGDDAEQLRQRRVVTQLFLEGLLGERGAATEVDYVQVVPLGDRVPSTALRALRPLSDLPGLVRQRAR